MFGHYDRILGGERSKPKNIGVTLKRFLAYFRRHLLQVGLLLVFLIASVYLQVLAPQIIGQAVDCYFVPDAGACWYDDAAAAGMSDDARLEGLLGIALFLLGIYLLASVFEGMSFYTMRWTGEHVLRRIRQDLFRQIHRLSLGYYARAEVGNDMSRITNDMTAIQQVFNFALIRVVSGVMLIVWIVVNMLRLNPAYAVISVLVAPVMVIATLYFSTQARKAFRVSRREMGSVNADLQEKIAGAREVQAFNNEAESIEKFREANAANRDASIRASMFTSALNPVLQALSFVAIGIVVLAGGISVLRNEPLLGTSVISLGLIFAFVQYVQRLSQPISQIAILWANIQNAIAGGERIFELLDTPADITEKPEAVELPPVKGHIVYEDVRMAYNADEPVLRGVDFSAEPGQMVAIVGPTGAGKTTIINLLPRFYDVTGGAVRIDGHDVRDVTLHSLRSQIGLVLQDTFLFSASILDNIRYGRLEASDEQVIEAAKMVGADAFIARLPEGYATVLGERGGGLSQGQRQLIAIARAALMQPNVLILDEATSSVDTRTERVIQAAFEKLLEGRTSFVIAHRLSTIRNADQVMMLVDGQIVERGTHTELLAHRGAYYDLYMSQFQRQEEAAATTPAEDPVAGD